eukprot:g4390.t1
MPRTTLGTRGAAQVPVESLLKGCVVAVDVVESRVPVNTPLKKRIEQMGGRVHERRGGDPSQITHLVWKNGSDLNLYNQCAVRGPEQVGIVNPLWIESTLDAGQVLPAEMLPAEPPDCLLRPGSAKKKKQQLQQKRGRQSPLS